MKQLFIFASGFAFNNTFWAPIISRFKENLPSFNYYYLENLPPNSNCCNTHTPLQCIGIGHSLGLIKLLNASLPFTHLIGLNSFTNFLGNAPHLNKQRTEEYNLFKKQFNKNITVTLKKFYSRCGLLDDSFLLRTAHNTCTQLEKDLNLLTKKVSFPLNTKNLIINSLDDQVVPDSITNDNFSNQTNVQIKKLNHGKHTLGFVHTEAICTEIIDFIIQC